VSVTFFLVTSPVSKTFAYLALALRVQYAICRFMFTVGSQYNFGPITASFQLEDVNSQWLAICCYSGLPGLNVGSVNLIWSLYENFAFISVVYLVA